MSVTHGDLVSVPSGAAYWLLWYDSETGLFMDTEILFGEGDVGMVIDFSETLGYEGQPMTKLLTGVGIGLACQSWLEVVSTTRVSS